MLDLNETTPGTRFATAGLPITETEAAALGDEVILEDLFPIVGSRDYVVIVADSTDSFVVGVRLTRQEVAWQYASTKAAAW